MRRIGAAASTSGLALGLSLVLALSGAAVSPLVAQQRSIGTPQPDQNLNPEDQLAPSQIKQAMPAAVAEPTGTAARPTSRPARPAAVDVSAQSAAPASKPAGPAAPRTVIACSGPFARDSGMLELAMIFDSKNMTFTQEKVQGVDVGITVLYPKDPKRRLEVWWSNPGSRSGTYLILINGKSAWAGPDGLRLGLNLLQLEKLNHKPFKIKGFDKDGNAAVTDWDSGELATLPGGCKSGVSMRADPKAAADAVSALSADNEYSSDDPAMRAVKPTVSEVLIGY